METQRRVHIHRILGASSVIHSAAILAIFATVTVGAFRIPSWPWWLHHLWVGLATLWLLWPLVLLLHHGRSTLRVTIPLLVSTVLLLPTLRAVPTMARVTFGLPLISYDVKYYDRNGDGRVDFELHHARNAVDADWSLSDTSFTGRYDLRTEHSPFGRQTHIDVPVPEHVKITSGQPDLSVIR